MGMRKNRMGKSLYVWIRSFLLTLSLLCGGVLLLLNWMIHSFSNEIMQLNHRLVANIQTGIDIRLNDIDNFMAQVSLNQNNLYLSGLDAMQEYGVEPMIAMFTSLNEYKLSNAFVESICIYYPKLDYVIGDVGYFPARQYYMLANEQDDSGYREWIRQITERENSGYYFKQEAGGEWNLYYSKWLPYNNSGEKDAILTVAIQKSEVERILKSDKYAENDSLNAIIGANGGIYAFSGDEEQRAWMETALQNEIEGEYIEAGQYSGCVQRSEFYDLSYATMYDRKQILQNVFFVRNMAYIVMLLCMAFASALFWMLGRRNNRPVRTILDKLYISGDRQTKDEYALIESSIETMLENDQLSQRKLQEQRDTMAGMFLYHVLAGEEKNNSVIFAAMQRFGLSLEYALFQVMLFRGKTEFLGEEIKVMRGRVQESAKMCGKKMELLATEFRGDFVLLLHMEEALGEDEEKSLTDAILLAGEELKGGGRLFIGRSYDTMSHIILSYQQARFLAETKQAGGERIIRFTADMELPKQEEKEQSAVMPEFEMAMLEGNYEGARKQVDRIFNQYIENDHHIFTARAKKYAVIHSLLEAMERTPELGDKREAYILKLQDAKDHRMLLETMHEIFAALTEVQSNRQKNSRDGCIPRAKEYIEQHFEDPMIGLYSISEQLGISNTYLSTAFKKQYGLGVAQYINYLRVEKAKKMMVNTEYSIKEIAFRVGFTSDMTFIRVFKQFEHITPGKYKKDGLGI